MGFDNNSSSIVIDISKPLIENCPSTAEVNPYISDHGFSLDISSYILQTYSLFICLCILSKNTRVRFPTLELISEVILVNLTFLLISPVLIGLAFVILTIRRVIGLYLRARYNGKVNLISNSDTFWGCDTYINTNYIYAQVIVEGECTLKQFQARIKAKLDPECGPQNRFQRMKCKVTKKLGFFCWEYDGNFRIQDHIRKISPNPLDTMTEKQILEHISRSYDYPMSDDRPKWEFQFIPNFKYENPKATTDIGKSYYSFIWKMNHVYMDGVSIINSLNDLYADQPGEMTVDVFKPLKVSALQLLYLNLKLALLGPHSLVKALFIKEKHCFHGPTVTGPKTLKLSRPINLDALKAIKNAKGTTITAISIALVGGAIRRLAVRKGLPPPESIYTGATCAMLPYKILEPINRFTIAHMPISIGSEHLSERLQSAAKSAHDLSRSVEFATNFHMVRFIGLFPAVFIKWFIDQTHCSLIFSNVPGPKGQLRMNGLPIKDLISWNVIKGTTGLGVCLLSYNGHIRAGVIGDSAVFQDESDMDHLVEEYENEMVDLAELCGFSKDVIFADN